MSIFIFRQQRNKKLIDKILPRIATHQAKITKQAILAASLVFFPA